MCNKDTKKCDIQKGFPLNECCKNNLMKLLSVIDIMFKKHNILYWIDYGTLLGSVRQGQIIPYDDDCDIGILRQDLDKILCLSDEFRLMGFHLVSWFYPNFLRLDYSRINELHVDIFAWDVQIMPFKEIWQEDRWQYNTACLYRKQYIQGKDENKGKHFPVEYLFPLDKSKIGNLSLPCPHKPDRFCEFRYGHDWRIEKKENK
jgi:phosphorylcholine metabolism protein LicD